jgi:hypothetical protein
VAAALDPDELAELMIDVLQRALARLQAAREARQAIST